MYISGFEVECHDTEFLSPVFHFMNSCMCTVGISVNVTLRETYTNATKCIHKDPFGSSSP